MPAIIETTRLARSFGSNRVVDGLDLRVEAGEIFGLLGPNGAGKTTTIRMLTTLLAPSSGTARVCGFDVGREAGEVRKRVGYVMQEIPRGLYALTARERVEMEASLYHVPRASVQATSPSERDLLAALQTQPWVVRVAGNGAGDVTVHVADGATAIPAIMRVATDAGLTLDRVTYSQPTLDDVFLLHTGHELRPTE